MLAPLGLQAFDRRFEDHFGITMTGGPLGIDDVANALAGKGWDEACETRCRSFPKFAHDPSMWGMKVKFILKLWTFIRDDLSGYAAAHGMDDEYRHVCYVQPCEWEHHCDCISWEEAGDGRVSQLNPNMHLVVQRYVKPWTKRYGVGLALMINAGHVARMPCMKAEDICHASVFISHSWAERFEDFIATLSKLGTDNVVWVCSFALNQNGNIAGALESIDRSPFAVAMHSATRVLVMADSSADVLSRCWVVLELHLATQKYFKKYDICLPDDSDEQLWTTVGEKLKKLDVQNCGAFDPADKQAILQYASRSDGGIAGLNSIVNQTATAAMKRAALMAAAANNNVDSIASQCPSSVLEWRSFDDQSLLHIAAKHNSISVLRKLLSMGCHILLEHCNDIGMTPLSMCADEGAIAGLHALLSSRADANHQSLNGFTTLHYTAKNGHLKAMQLLLHCKACTEVHGCNEGFPGHTPLSVASWHGHAKLVRVLTEHKAQLEHEGVSTVSALHMTALNGHVDTAVILIGMRASIDSQNDHYGRTPLMLAVQHGHVAMVALLVSLGARQDICCPSYAWNQRKLDGLQFFVELCGREGDESHAAEMIKGLLDRRGQDRGNSGKIKKIIQPMDECPELPKASEAKELNIGSVASKPEGRRAAQEHEIRAMLVFLTAGKEGHGFVDTADVKILLSKIAGVTVADIPNSHPEVRLLAGLSAQQIACYLAEWADPELIRRCFQHLTEESPENAELARKAQEVHKA